MQDAPMTQQIEGNWNQLKGKIKEAWGDLTDDELDRYEGKMDQLKGYIQEKTGENRAAVRSRIEQLAREAKYSI